MASKTLTINISGMVFPMTEDAYDALQDYLKSVNKYFARRVGRDEIVADLESRIAEHFSAKVSTKHQVLLKKDVEKLVAIMGQVEDFEMEEIAEEEEVVQPVRLYRDTENGALGGVCYGLGYYFNVDPVLISVLFILSILAGGLGLLLYILLWIFVPEAKTAYQKEQMKKGRFDMRKEMKRLSKKVRKGMA